MAVMTPDDLTRVNVFRAALQYSKLVAGPAPSWWERVKEKKASEKPKQILPEFLKACYVHP